ncbi:MAG: hypothetical protein Q7R87_03470 [Nanoarchaeota archaeon]|nr:hypothetical protein [Nanoarchaeota archaeon]
MKSRLLSARKGSMRVPDIMSGMPSDQMTREHPSYDGLSKPAQLKTHKFADDYSRFLDDARIAPDVVEKVRDMFERYKPRNSFFMTNQDETAFAMVNYGSQPIANGINIIYSHTDSPCLRAKVRPISLQWDHSIKELYTGVEIDTMGYGGISPHQWAGHTLELRGWTIKDGQKIKLPRLLVYSPEVCAHTDQRPSAKTKFDEAHRQEGLDLVTGYRKIPDFLKALKLNNEIDFARSAVFFVPQTKVNNIGPYFISGYGHDNRSCVYASVKAALESNIKKPSIVIGFDREEVGSDGPGGANGKFFEKVLDTMLVRSRTVKRVEEITSGLERKIFENSIAINADTDVGSTHKEVDIIDQHNAARMGFGVILNASDGTFSGDQISPHLVDYVMGVLQKKKVIFQPIGSAMPADQSHGTPSANEFFVRRGIPTITVGTPVGSLHSPAELLHMGDLYSAKLAYRALLEA